MNQTDVYSDQMLPIIEKLYAIAVERDIPLIVVAQINDEEHKISLNIPKHAHKEVKESAQWWLQGTGKVVQ
jgi:hypothetical protein